jgi:hypothetical protein
MDFRILILLLITTSPIVAQDTAIRVAVFQGAGVGPSSEKLMEALQAGDSGFRVTRLTADEIRR